MTREKTMFLPLLRLSGLRYLLRHPWLLILSVVGVAMGVAVVVSIDLTNSSARRAFSRSAETVTGRATHQIVGATEDAVPEAVYRRLRIEVGVRTVSPVVEGYVTAFDGQVFRMMGVDPLAEGPFRSYVGPRMTPNLGQWMRWGGVLSSETASAHGISPSDTITVMVEGVAKRLPVLGVMDPTDIRSAEATRDLILVDISTAQEILGMVGRLSHIDLILPEGNPGRDLRARIRSILPPGTEVVRSSARTETVAQMTRAFEMNLTALSLLALVVGMFLIYNTMTFSVVQRRPVMGRLRALGVTRAEVFALVLGEAAAVGVLGTGLGIMLGFELAQGLVTLVTRTINDLYYVVAVHRLSLEPWTVAKGVGLGVGATLVAALAPARDAMNVPVTDILRRSHIEERARRIVPRAALAGAVLGLIGWLILRLSGQSIAFAYLALFAIMMGYALLTPAAVVGLARMLRPVMGKAFGILGRMAAGAIEAALSRTAVAVAALLVALAATIGVGVMVDSFRQTVETWLGYALQADVYVQPPSLVARQNDATLAPEVIRRLTTTSGVANAYTIRRLDVSSPLGRTRLVAIDVAPSTERAFRFKAGNPATVWEKFGDDDAVIISEPYSYRHHLALGDALSLTTDHGPHVFRVVGIYYDYASDLGVVMMGRPLFEYYYTDRHRSGLALYAAPGTNLDALIERLRKRAAGVQKVTIRSNRALREASLEVFDRTFTVTIVLRFLAVLVAFVGVLSALMALQIERIREFAVLRATGLTPSELWRYVTMETGLMGIMAGVLSLPLGLLLALVLVFVINKRSFGWTLQFSVAPEILWQALLVAFVAAILAGLYPAWHVAKTHPAEALREA